MNATTHIARTHCGLSGTQALVESRGDVSPVVTDRPTFRELVFETLPLVGAVFVAGPPVVFVGGPWLLFVLMLLGPFVLLCTLAVALVAGMGLLALCWGILATPYLLVRRMRGHKAVHAPPVLAIRSRAPVIHA